MINRGQFGGKSNETKQTNKLNQTKPPNWNNRISPPKTQEETPLCYIVQYEYFDIWSWNAVKSIELNRRDGSHQV